MFILLLSGDMRNKKADYLIYLTRIELENFGPFFKQNETTFDFSDQKNVLLIEGDTGSGKTSFITAISWCLFGTYRGETELLQADFKLFNQDALLISKINETVSCRVTLTFERDDGKSSRDKITFSRQMSLKKKRANLTRTARGSIYLNLNDFEFVRSTGSSTHQNFTAIKWINNKPDRTSSYPDLLRETYFPEIVRDYYIIFGEGFVDPKNRLAIQIAIEKNCRSDLFDKLGSNLDLAFAAVLKNTTHDTKNRNQVSKLTEQLKDNTIQLGVNVKQHDQNKSNIAKLGDAISTLDRKIGESGSATVKLLIDERVKLIQETNVLDKNRGVLRSTLVEDGAPILIQLLSHPSQTLLLEELEKRVKKSELPPNIKPGFIDGLLSQRQCICGTKINDKMKQELKKVRSENLLGNNSTKLLDLKYDLVSIKSSVPKLVGDYRELLDDMDETEQKSNEKTSRLTTISEQLDSLSSVQKLNAERTKLNSVQSDLITSNLILKQEIDGLRDDNEQINAEIRRISTRSGRTSSDEALIEFITTLKKSIDQLKQLLITSTRKDIESYASTVYKDLVKNAFEIERLELDDEYSVRVIIKKHGEHVKMHFSTGESLIFAMSFLTALRKYSGYTGPIFLDSPFSVLDAEYRTRVSINLPTAIPGQLIICTRPDTVETEIKPKIAEYINKSISLIKESEWHTKIM